MRKNRENFKKIIYKSLFFYSIINIIQTLPNEIILEL